MTKLEELKKICDEAEAAYNEAAIAAYYDACRDETYTADCDEAYEALTAYVEAYDAYEEAAANYKKELEKQDGQ